MSSAAAPELSEIEIAVIGPQRPALVAALEARFKCHHVHAEPDPLAYLDQHGARFRGAVGSGMAGLQRKHMDRMPNVEICAINGVGLEMTDLALAREKGIAITITPVLYDDVADLALALALAACRRIAHGDRFVRNGDWLKGRLVLGRKLTGMKAGLIGLGRIGSEVASRLRGFKCDIAYVDPVARDVPYRRVADAVTLASESDILFLCAAGAARGTAAPIVSRQILEALGPRGTFVNIARGWLVDEPAMVELLASGGLGAAGLDVFDDEPHVPEALLGLDNVVLTPHIASSTEECMGAMGDTVIANLVSWFEGKGALAVHGAQAPPLRGCQARWSRSRTRR
ncbi:MAG: NAD(P)-dependent oxidoreductase [Geminicoccaceae bacterium]